MIILYLIIYLIILSYILSAVSGIIMFIFDIFRFGKPHSKFVCESSIESYNEKLQEEFQIKESDNILDSISIDL